MPRLTLTISLLLSLLYCFGQNTYVRPIPEINSALARSTTDTTRARLLLDLALSYVYKTGEYPNDLDSALLLIQQADKINSSIKDPYLEAKSFFVRSNTLREKGDTAHGILYAQKAIGQFASTPYKLQTGEAYIELAQYYPISTQSGLDNKTECWQQALASFKAADLKEREAYALKNLGDLHYLSGNYGQAMVQLQQAKALYSSIGYQAVQGIYDLMGVISRCLSDYPQAVAYGLQAVRTAALVHDTTLQLCTIYFRLATEYDGWGRRTEALVYWKKAFDIAYAYKDRSSLYTIQSTLCNVYAMSGKWQDAIRLVTHIKQLLPPLNLNDTINIYMSYTLAYVMGQQYDQAKPYSTRMLAIAQQHHDDLILLEDIYRCLLICTDTMKQYRQMSIYADEYIRACTGTFPPGLPWAFLMRSRADSAMGNFQSALKWYQKDKNMMDSIFNATKSMQFSQLQVQYETEKKDNDLQLLTNKSQLQEMSLKKASLTRNIIIGAAILLLALLYSGYKIKQRHNARLQQQQTAINHQNHQLKDLLAQEQKLVDEKEWLVREIHHRVKNNLQMVISLLNTQSEFLDDPAAYTAIRESRQRMQAIAIIHQKLYRPDVDTFIDMASYISEMIEHLKDGFVNTEKVFFKIDVENINLDVSQAVPLGLIINEAITNSLKHAFPGHRKGHIIISLHYTSENNILLNISDDGQGFPDDMLTHENSSMGIQLIKLFSEQLEGKLQFHTGPGAGITLIHPSPKPPSP